MDLFTLLAIVSPVFSLEFTVSGIGSGANMAVQLHVAYSSQISGVGIFAGAPYYCAFSGNLDGCFTKPWLYNKQKPIEYVQEKSESKEIDDIQNLKKSKVWLFSGFKDSIIKSDVTRNLGYFYANFGASVNQRFDIAAEHAWITSFYGQSCDELGEPFMSNCHFDAAGHLLQTILNRDLNRGDSIPFNLFVYD